MAAFVVILLITIFIIATWFKQTDQTQRQTAMSQLAGEMGLEFFEEDIFNLEEQLDFELFRHPEVPWHEHRISNVLSGRLGETQVFLFEYSYADIDAESRHLIRQTVFLAIDPSWSLPDFCLRRKPGWQKTVGTIGLPSGIEMREAADFSKTYLLTGKNKTRIQHLFDPAVQIIVAGYADLRLEVSGPYLVAYQPGVRLSVAYDTRAFYEDCCELVELLKNKN